jgi:hypothetical protein
MKYLLARLLSAIGLSQHFIWKMGLPYQLDRIPLWNSQPQFFDYYGVEIDPNFKPGPIVVWVS